MIIRTLASAAVLGVAALAASGQAARAVTILPAFNGTTECVSGALVVDNAGPCTAGGAAANFTPSPFAGVTASAIGGPSISNGGLAFLTYFYTIDGPNTDPVTVDIFTNLSTSVAGGPNNVAFASLFDTEGHQICAILGSIGCNGVGGVVNAGELTEQETPGLVYSIELEVEASTVGGAGNTAFASADPLIIVDPTTLNAGLYSIRLSAGVGNGLPPSGTPEPAAWVAMLAGFGLAGASLRARRWATA